MKKKQKSEEVSDAVVEVIKIPFKVVEKTFNFLTNWMD